jgi:hypothetical protein
VRYIDVVLAEAKTRAWEDLSDEQREVYLEASIRASGTRQPKSVIRRWAVQTGPVREETPPSRTKKAR